MSVERGSNRHRFSEGLSPIRNRFSGEFVSVERGSNPEQYYICKSMSLWATEKQTSRETTNISKANDLLTTLSRNILVSAVIPFEGVTPTQK